MMTVNGSRLDQIPNFHIEGSRFYTSFFPKLRYRGFSHKAAKFPTTTFKALTIKGLVGKIDFENNWVHLRKSNTEPIIRCIVEAKTEEEANNLVEKYFAELS